MTDADSGEAGCAGQSRPLPEGAGSGVRCDRCGREGASGVGEEFLCGECFQLAGACCAGGETDG